MTRGQPSSILPVWVSQAETWWSKLARLPPEAKVMAMLKPAPDLTKSMPPVGSMRPSEPEAIST
jgi:hypothetical protein